MKDIHENGWTKAIYDRDERETYQLTMFYTFEDRFNALQELLMVCISDSVLYYHFLYCDRFSARKHLSWDNCIHIHSTQRPPAKMS